MWIQILTFRKCICAKVNQMNSDIIRTRSADFFIHITSHCTMYTLIRISIIMFSSCLNVVRRIKKSCSLVNIIIVKWTPNRMDVFESNRRGSYNSQTRWSQSSWCFFKFFICWTPKKKKAEMLESQWHGEFSVSSSQDFPLKLVQ